jgi:23S rRNA (guanosine2251-2'-O)-methyltransferase
VKRVAAARPRAARGRHRAAPAPPERESLVGIHPVHEALRARRRTLHRLLLRGGGVPLRGELAMLADLAAQAGIPVGEESASVFDARVPEGVSHQGVLLEAGPVPAVSLEDLIPPADSGGWLVALDGIEDPQNLGAILRVADAAGVRGALLPERRIAPLSPAAARASAGALEHLPVARVTNLARALGSLKDHGFWVHGATPEAPLDLYETPDRLFDRRLVLVLGSEGRGLRPGVRSAVDTLYRIPMQGQVASLNVATAAAVVLFEWARRGREAARGAGS